MLTYGNKIKFSVYFQLSVDIPPNREDCFYLPDVKFGSTIELEFQVTRVHSDDSQYSVLGSSNNFSNFMKFLVAFTK